MIAQLFEPHPQWSLPQWAAQLLRLFAREWCYYVQRTPGCGVRFVHSDDMLRPGVLKVEKTTYYIIYIMGIQSEMMRNHKFSGYIRQTCDIQTYIQIYTVNGTTCNNTSFYRCNRCQAGHGNLHMIIWSIKLHELLQDLVKAVDLPTFNWEMIGILLSYCYHICYHMTDNKKQYGHIWSYMNMRY